MSDKYVDVSKVYILKIAIGWEEESKAWEYEELLFKHNMKCIVVLWVMHGAGGSSFMPAWLLSALWHFCLTLSFSEMYNLIKDIGIDKLIFCMLRFNLYSKKNPKTCFVHTYWFEGHSRHFTFLPWRQSVNSMSLFLCSWTALLFRVEKTMKKTIEPNIWVKQEALRIGVVVKNNVGQSTILIIYNCIMLGATLSLMTWQNSNRTNKIFQM